jgi:hypothetical protein
VSAALACVGEAIAAKILFRTGIDDGPKLRAVPDLQQGQFFEVRGRPWLVETVDDRESDLTTLRLSCLADDAQGEQIEVLWDAEIGARIIQDDSRSQVGRGAPHSPEVLAAYLRAIRHRGRPRSTVGAISCRDQAGRLSTAAGA